MYLYTSYTDSLGIHHKDEAIAQFENGRVYLAADGVFGIVGKGGVIAEYENGRIYSVKPPLNTRENLIAVCENGYIYGVYSAIGGGYAKTSALGECSGGSVFSQGNGVIGKYDGDSDGAAAAAAVLLFGLKSDVSAFTYNMPKDRVEISNPDKGSAIATAAGGGSMAFVLVLLFLIVLIFMILAEYKEYMTLLFYVAIPLIRLLIHLFKKRHALSEKGFKPEKNCFKGILASLAVSFLYVLVTIGVFMHAIATVQIFNLDLGITITFILNAITAIIKSI